MPIIDPDAKLIVPPDKMTGCLYRTTRPGGADFPMASDRMKVIPVREWSDLIGSIDTRPNVDLILDQNGNGSCACESPTQAECILRSIAGRPFVQLNPLFIYHTTSDGYDQGSNIDRNLLFVQQRGIAPESIWPRSKGFKARPSEEAVEEAKKYKLDEVWDVTTTEEFGTALLLGFPVVFGWDGHSCVATSLIDERTFEYANSWGDWGDEGFGRLRLSAVNFGYGAWCPRTASV